MKNRKSILPAMPKQKAISRPRVTVTQAAKILGVWPTYVRTLIHMQKLVAVKKGGTWFLDEGEVREYAEQLRIKRQVRSDVLAGDGDAA